MDYLTLNAAEVAAFVRNVDDGGEDFVRSVQLSRRDSLDNPYPEGFLVISIVTADGEQQRYAISETGSTTLWGS
jgi:hypothetical protein